MKSTSGKTRKKSKPSVLVNLRKQHRAKVAVTRKAYQEALRDYKSLLPRKPKK